MLSFDNAKLLLNWITNVIIDYELFYLSDILKRNALIHIIQPVIRGLIKYTYS